MNTVLLTGSTGFVGSALLPELKKLPDFRIISTVRSSVSSASDDVVVVGNIDGITEYSSALNDVSVVIHVAGRAHILRDEMADPLAEFRKVNVDGALNLARQAAVAGVKRFVFISSVNVHGISSFEPYSEDDELAARDPFSISKREAEEGLRLLAQETGLEVVIIRPPLVYGPGVKANFLSLVKLSASGLPLPFGSVNNNRSMVYVGNLVSFIIRCIQHPAAANQTFLVCDGEDVSLRNLVTYIRLCLGRSPRLLPVPVGLFKLAGALTGKRGVVDRLVGDLQVDSTKARTLLEWVPPFTVSQGIEATVADFMNKDK